MRSFENKLGKKTNLDGCSPPSNQMQRDVERTVAARRIKIRTSTTNTLLRASGTKPITRKKPANKVTAQNKPTTSAPQQAHAKRLKLDDRKESQISDPFLLKLQEFFEEMSRIDAVYLNAESGADLEQYELPRRKIELTYNTLVGLNENDEVELSVKEIEAILRIWLRRPLRNETKRSSNHSEESDNFIRTRAASIMRMFQEERDIASILVNIKQPVTMDTVGEDDEVGLDVEPRVANHIPSLFRNDQEPSEVIGELCRLFYRPGLEKISNVA